MAATRKGADDGAIVISPIKMETIAVGILGRTPFIFNRMATKAKQEIVFPKGRKTAADRATTMKHNPIEEYRESPYTLAREGDSAPTFLCVLAAMFKGAMATAALDTPGSSKAQIGRLLQVEGNRLPLWGTPQLMMSVVRSAGINRTPDVRTRAIVPDWGTVIRITYAIPLLNQTSVVNLLTAAGTFAGVGDFRAEKGKGNYGQFEVVGIDDPRLRAIMREDERSRQIAALETDSPEFYDDETEELFTWFYAEAERRGKHEILKKVG